MALESERFFVGPLGSDDLDAALGKIQEPLRKATKLALEMFKKKGVAVDTAGRFNLVTAAALVFLDADLARIGNSPKEKQMDIDDSYPVGRERIIEDALNKLRENYPPFSYQ